MKMKYLRITMPDGSKWDVPCEVIAKNRASFYAEKGDSYQEEFDYTMGIDFELRDWAADNMNWDEVEEFATKAPEEQQEPVDYQEGWVNGEKEIIEK
jgi:hypothetical protein